MKGTWWRLGVASLATLALALTAVACGGSSSSGGGGATGSVEKAVVGEVEADGTIVPPPLPGNPPAEAKQALEEFVPESMHVDYDHYWTFAKLGANPYTSWKPSTAPYKFCLAETYLGNAWRQGSLQALKDEVTALEKEGIADGPLTVTNANGNISVHQSQINQLVDQGCDVIWSLTAGPTGICKAVTNAKESEVLFMTIETPVDCPDAMNVDFNEAVEGGSTNATALVNLMGGKGKVLMVNGIPGLRVSAARQESAKAIFEQAPDIEVAGEVEGDFTASVAKTAVLKYLSTHPEEINGVYDAGGMATAAAQAFQQAGRPLPAMTDFSGSCSWLAFWNENKLDSFSIDQGPAAAVQEAVQITRRMLDGEQPSTNLILYPLPQITKENLSKWLTPEMTVDSSCFAEPPENKAVPDSYFDPLFG